MIAAFLDHASVLAQQFESLDGRFLLGALVLQVSNLALRSFAWRNVLAAAYPEQRVSYLSVAGSYVAGVALNTFTPGRAGELAKVLLVRTRIAGSAVPTIAAALSVVLVFDAIVGGGLVAALWAGGIAPGIPAPGAPVLLAAAAAGSVVALGTTFAARRSSRARRLLTRAWAGVAIVRSPGRYLGSVALVQLGAWMCRTCGSIRMAIGPVDPIMRRMSTPTSYAVAWRNGHTRFVGYARLEPAGLRLEGRDADGSEGLRTISYEDIGRIDVSRTNGEPRHRARGQRSRSSRDHESRPPRQPRRDGRAAPRPHGFPAPLIRHSADAVSAVQSDARRNGPEERS